MKHNLKAADSFLAHQRRAVICTSFFGLEDAVSMPPNIVMTGPLYDPPSDTMNDLKAKDLDLYDWLE